MNHLAVKIDQDTVDSSLISKIATLEPEHVKWKSSEDCASQVVVKDSRYYYKVYKIDRYADWLKMKIIELIGRYYQQVLGIEWNLTSIELEDSDIVYIVEQRQPLHSIRLSDGLTIDEVLEGFRPILEKIEEQLDLRSIEKRLGTDYRLRLIRKCVPKFDDYALYNNAVVLLDDADFFLVPTDSRGEVCSVETDYYLLDDDLVLVPETTVKMEKAYTWQSFWTLRKIKKNSSVYYSALKKNLIASTNREIYRALRPVEEEAECDRATLILDLPRGATDSLESTEQYLDRLSVIGSLINSFYVVSDYTDPREVENLVRSIVNRNKRISLVTEHPSEALLSCLYSLLSDERFYSWTSLTLVITEGTPRRVLDMIPGLYKTLGQHLVVVPVLGRRLLSYADILHREYSVPVSPILGVSVDELPAGIPEGLLSTLATDDVPTREELLAYLSSSTTLLYPLFLKDTEIHVVSGYREIPSRRLIEYVTGYGQQRGRLFRDLISIRDSRVF